MMHGTGVRGWIVVALLCPAAALADGKAFKVQDLYGAIPLQQNEQVAAICHHDGHQLMRIAINVDLEPTRPVCGSSTCSSISVRKSHQDQACRQSAERYA